MSGGRAICLLKEEHPVFRAGKWSTATRDVGYVLGEARGIARLRRHVQERAAAMNAEKVTEHAGGGLPEFLVLDPVEGKAHSLYLTLAFEMAD